MKYLIISSTLLFAHTGFADNNYTPQVDEALLALTSTPPVAQPAISLPIFQELASRQQFLTVSTDSDSLFNTSNLSEQMRGARTIPDLSEQMRGARTITETQRAEQQMRGARIIRPSLDDVQMFLTGGDYNHDITTFVHLGTECIYKEPVYDSKTNTVFEQCQEFKTCHPWGLKQNQLAQVACTCKALTTDLIDLDYVPSFTHIAESESVEEAENEAQALCSYYLNQDIDYIWNNAVSDDLTSGLGNEDLELWFKDIETSCTSPFVCQIGYKHEIQEQEETRSSLTTCSSNDVILQIRVPYKLNGVNKTYSSDTGECVPSARNSNGQQLNQLNCGKIYEGIPGLHYCVIDSGVSYDFHWQNPRVIGLPVAKAGPMSQALFRDLLSGTINKDDNAVTKVEQCVEQEIKKQSEKNSEFEGFFTIPTQIVNGRVHIKNFAHGTQSASIEFVHCLLFALQDMSLNSVADVHGVSVDFGFAVLKKITLNNE